jgi:hypothetical protein
MFDDIMLATYQMSVSVETYFLKYTRRDQAVLTLDEFNRGI